MNIGPGFGEPWQSPTKFLSTSPLNYFTVHVCNTPKRIKGLEPLSSEERLSCLEKRQESGQHNRDFKNYERDRERTQKEQLPTHNAINWGWRKRSTFLLKKHLNCRIYCWWM